MTQNELASLSDAWISYRHAPEGSPKRGKYSWATDLYDLEYHEPETLRLLILEIHRRDKSAPVQQVLSAGPIENLLAIHGESFIERVEAEARKDPAFAKVLGGVWKTPERQLPAKSGGIHVCKIRASGETSRDSAGKARTSNSLSPKPEARGGRRLSSGTGDRRGENSDFYDRS